MAQPEARLTRKIRVALQTQYPDIFVFKVWGSEYQMAGLPDLIGCYRGIFFGLEVKMPAKRNNVSISQQHVLMMIRRAGGIGEVVCTPNEAIAIIHNIP
jgi:hypothetical protein